MSKEICIKVSDICAGFVGNESTFHIVDTLPDEPVNGAYLTAEQPCPVGEQNVSAAVSNSQADEFSSVNVICQGCTKHPRTNGFHYMRGSGTISSTTNPQ